MRACEFPFSFPRGWMADAHVLKVLIILLSYLSLIFTCQDTPFQYWYFFSAIQ